MAITPFEQANFNLVSFSEAYNDIFDSTAKDVSIQLKDSNGNIYTKTVANRGKFKQQLWDDVGGALGQFNITFYVDATNGDDNNDGSSANPFKTIKKACDSVPVGGNATINLAQNQTYLIDSDINVTNKRIYIIAINATIKNVAYLYNDNTATRGFILRKSEITFLGGTIKTANKISDNNPVHPYSGIIKRNEFASGYVKTISSDIEIGDTDFIRKDWAPTQIDLDISGGTINKTGEGYLIRNENGTFRIGANESVTLGKDADGSSLTWGKLIIGIIKDSNGVPRNVISNIVF